MSVREQLRIQTGALHRLAEKVTSQNASVDTLKGYCKFLRAMKSLYTEHAKNLDKSSEFLELPKRSTEIIDELDKDIASCGLTLTEIPSSFSKELMKSEKGLLLGTAYVFEGSALGSIVLLKKLKDNKETKNLRHGYLTLMNQGIKLRWPRTIKALNKFEKQSNGIIEQSKKIFSQVADKMVLQ